MKVSLSSTALRVLPSRHSHKLGEGFDHGEHASPGRRVASDVARPLRRGEPHTSSGAWTSKLMSSPCSEDSRFEFVRAHPTRALILQTPLSRTSPPPPSTMPRRRSLDRRGLSLSAAGSFYGPPEPVSVDPAIPPPRPSRRERPINVDVQALPEREMHRSGEGPALRRGPLLPPPACPGGSPIFPRRWARSSPDPSVRPHVVRVLRQRSSTEHWRGTASRGLHLPTLHAHARR